VGVDAGQDVRRPRVRLVGSSSARTMNSAVFIRSAPAAAKAQGPPGGGTICHPDAHRATRRIRWPVGMSDQRDRAQCRRSQMIGQPAEQPWKNLGGISDGDDVS